VGIGVEGAGMKGALIEDGRRKAVFRTGISPTRTHDRCDNLKTNMKTMAH